MKTSEADGAQILLKKWEEGHRFKVASFGIYTRVTDSDFFTYKVDDNQGTEQLHMLDKK